MNRAEMRRLAKKQTKKTKTYTLTGEQVDKLKHDTVQRAINVSRALMYGVVMNVLGHCYWEKTAHKKLPKLMVECESLYESLEAGVLSINELIEDTEKLANLESEYFKKLKQDKEMWKKMNMNE